MKRLFAVLGLIIFASAVMADARRYAWTYQHEMVLPGEVEIEVYSKMDQKDMNVPLSAKWKNQVEIEFGLHEYLDAAVYFVESYSEKAGVKTFDEIKLRLRKKITKKDEFFVDVMAYVEYKLQTNRTYPDKWEFKLITSKDVGDLNISFNYIPEETHLSYSDGHKSKYWKHEYAFGISYSLFDGSIGIGSELKGDWTNGKHALGPVVSFEAGKVWGAVSPLYAISDKADHFTIQGILGVVF